MFKNKFIIAICSAILVTSQLVVAMEPEPLFTTKFADPNKETIIKLSEFATKNVQRYQIIKYPKYGNIICNPFAGHCSYTAFSAENIFEPSDQFTYKIFYEDGTSELYIIKIKFSNYMGAR